MEGIRRHEEIPFSRSSLIITLQTLNESSFLARLTASTSIFPDSSFLVHIISSEICASSWSAHGTCPSSLGFAQGARNAGQLTTDRREKVDPSIERVKNAT